MRKVGCKGIKFGVIYRYRDKYPIQDLCKLLGVSRSGYYKWQARQGQPDRDGPLAKQIMQCQEKSHKTYGYRRVKLWLLREAGLVIDHKAVLRITRKYGLQATPRKKRFRHYDLDTYHHYENLLQRDFQATRPNEKWVTDISYIPTGKGFLYLSVIKDLYDRSIVGYRYARQMPAKLVLDTIHDAVANSHRDRGDGGLILHSDNGFQYASIPYHNVTQAYGITPSMSAVGCPYDNACAESFFSLLKNECIYQLKPRTIQAAAELVDEYIHFYNFERIQLATKMTPMEMRLGAAE